MSEIMRRGFVSSERQNTNECGLTFSALVQVDTTYGDFTVGLAQNLPLFGQKGLPKPPRAGG